MGQVSRRSGIPARFLRTSEDSKTLAGLTAASVPYGIAALGRLRYCVIMGILQQRVGVGLTAGVLLLGLRHALREKHFELAANLLGFALELVQELAFLVLDQAVSEKHASQPGGLLGVDPCARQDVVLDGLVIELVEGWREMLNPFVQFDEEVGPSAVDLPVDVNSLAQHFQVMAIDLAMGQDVVFDLSQFRHNLAPSSLRDGQLPAVKGASERQGTPSGRRAVSAPRKYHWAR